MPPAPSGATTSYLPSSTRPTSGSLSTTVGAEVSAVRESAPSRLTVGTDSPAESSRAPPPSRRAHAPRPQGRRSFALRPQSQLRPATCARRNACRTALPRAGAGGIEDSSSRKNVRGQGGRVKGKGGVPALPLCPLPLHLKFFLSRHAGLK